MIVDIALWSVKTIGKTLLALVLLWLYKELTMGICRCKKSLEGKVAVLTGASSGIGLEIAAQLAKRGCRVILACRNISKAEKAMKKIQEIVPDADLDIVELQLARLKSIEQFAQEVSEIVDEIHLLVNNAGVFYINEDKLGQTVKKHTEDGLELAVGVNYFGHVYLTQSLMTLLKAGGKPDDPSRIINLSSFGHIQGTLQQPDFDLNANHKMFDPSYQYCASKLALMHWSNKLARNLISDNVVSVNVNPGLVRTAIFDNTPDRVKTLMTAACWLLGKNVEQGAQCVLHACLLPNPMETVNGQYLADCRPVGVMVSKQLGHRHIEDSLWDYTNDLLESIVA